VQLSPPPPPKKKKEKNILDGMFFGVYAALMPAEVFKVWLLIICKGFNYFYIIKSLQRPIKCYEFDVLYKWLFIE